MIGLYKINPALVIARLLDELDAARAAAETTAAQSIAEWGRLKGRVNEVMDACDRLGKERDEALQWRGVAASVEREAAEDRARLEEAIRERDDLRTAARALRDLRVSSCHLCGRLATRQVGTKLEGDRATRCHLICDFCSPDRACSSQGALVEWTVDLNAAAVIRPLLAEGADGG